MVVAQSRLQFLILNAQLVSLNLVNNDFRIEVLLRLLRHLRDYLDHVSSVGALGVLLPRGFGAHLMGSFERTEQAALVERRYRALSRQIRRVLGLGG